MTAAMSTLSQPTIRFILSTFAERIAKPSLRAFLFAYLYVVIPKALNHIIVAIKRNDLADLPKRLATVLARALHPKKFPMFTAYIVAGTNLLEPIVFKIVQRLALLKSRSSTLFISTLVSGFISAIITFPQFQNHILGYGRYYSLDLTLLLTTRALDTLVSSTLAHVVPSILQSKGDALLFILSSFLVMFSWFYKPESLPPSYRGWITAAANMDDELIWALKGLREGTLVYGEHGPLEDILVPMAERYGQDPKRGSLIHNQPIECEVVHAFTTKNCEVHALWRFYRGFVFSLKVYGPLNALMLLFPNKSKMSTRIWRAFLSTCRSSCFLGTFISLYWYGVCLVRNRLFPKLFPNKPLVEWDITWGPTVGAMLCGLSSFVETQGRRKELALFVAPRGLGTLVPTEPSEINLRIEAIVFSFSLAVLVAFSKKDPKSVRGIFGKGFQQVFKI
ncbi:hypothetical protein G9P44_005110 [Scheffersomyces stipitis]|nr:hypothetical protein G9P44_005110 [Scheffersomyces stipitis]